MPASAWNSAGEVQGVGWRRDVCARRGRRHHRCGRRRSGLGQRNDPVRRDSGSRSEPAALTRTSCLPNVGSRPKCRARRTSGSPPKLPQAERRARGAGGRAGRCRGRPGAPGRRRCPSTSSVGVAVDVALDQAQGDRARARSGGPSCRRSRPCGPRSERGAGGGQGVGAAVQLQPDQPAGRAAEGVDAGDRLLAAVAALVQVHRRPRAAELVGNRSVVGVQADPRDAGGDPAGLVRPGAGSRLPSRPRRQLGARHEVLVTAEGVRARLAAPRSGGGVAGSRPRRPRRSGRRPRPAS